MDSESQRLIQNAVEQINQMGEMVRESDELQELLSSLDGLPTDYIHTHEPWDRSFIIWVDDRPAQVQTAFHDRWSVTPGPRKGAVERANIYAKKTGGDRPMLPKLIYEPSGEETTAIELELHPVEGDEFRFRAVAKDGSPVPDIEIQVHDLGIDGKTVDARRHFEEGQRVRIDETEETGTIFGMTGPYVTVDTSGDAHPDNIETVNATKVTILSDS